MREKENTVERRGARPFFFCTPEEGLRGRRRIERQEKDYTLGEKCTTAQKNRPGWGGS